MKLKKKLSPYLTLIFLVAFVIYIAHDIHSFTPLLKISAILVVAITVTKFFTYVVNGLFTKWTVEVFTERLKFTEGVYLAILTSIGNYFGPLLGGATIRAVYLKKIHKLSYANFTSTLAGYYVILFIANSLLAIVSLLLLSKSSYRSGLLAFFIVWLAVLIALMFVRLPAREKLKRLESYRLTKFIIGVVYDIESGWQSLIKDKLLVSKLCLLGLAGFLITAVTTVLEFHALGASISIAAVGFYTAMINSSLLINLTPGAIGIRESLLLLTSSVMGITNTQILQVAVIDRGITLLTLIILYATTYFLKPKKKII